MTRFNGALTQVELSLASLHVVDFEVGLGQLRDQGLAALRTLPALQQVLPLAQIGEGASGFGLVFGDGGEEAGGDAGSSLAELLGCLGRGLPTRLHSLINLIYFL